MQKCDLLSSSVTICTRPLWLVGMRVTYSIEYSCASLYLRGLRPVVADGDETCM
jgi:hypothetical protein